MTTITVVFSVLLLNAPVDSFAMTMKTASSASSGKASSLLFVTNKMCPFAQKAWIALEAAEIPYKFEQISLYGGGGKPAWFMELNPKGQVPVLVVNDDSDNDRVIFADSDLILNEMGMVMDSSPPNTQSSSTGKGLVVVGPNDDENVAKIKEFRSVLNEFLPIGKSAVLGGDKERMWSKLRELDALMDTEGQPSYIVVGIDRPTVADCASFPFLWRIDQEYSGLWEKNGCSNIPVWLEFCKEQQPFKNSIQGSWWWWW
mmetsp:Transcript_16619/g.38035  ORF Transcript_16619/g.38035 Transcript_16619/m.38035 type:complete len:258 (+) Transcript_16619:3-776(+)